MAQIASIVSRGVAIDDHGGDCCPHSVNVYMIAGSNNLFSNGNPVMRIGDRVAHDGPHPGGGNIITGSSVLTNNGIGVARLGDRVVIDNGSGSITSNCSVNFTTV